MAYQYHMPKNNNLFQNKNILQMFYFNLSL